MSSTKVEELELGEGLKGKGVAALIARSVSTSLIRLEAEFRVLARIFVRNEEGCWEEAELCAGGKVRLRA